MQLENQHERREPGAVSPPAMPEKTLDVREVPSIAREAVKTVGEQIGRAAREVQERGRAKAQDFLQWARTEGGAVVDQQRQRAAEEIGHFASALDAAADRLNHEGDRAVGMCARDIGQRLMRVADYVRERSGSDLVEDARNGIRRRPELFFGGMFLTGLLVARFLKASQRAPRETDAFDAPETEPYSPHIAKPVDAAIPTGGEDAWS